MVVDRVREFIICHARGAHFLLFVYSANLLEHRDATMRLLKSMFAELSAANCFGRYERLKL